jgi:hypothetical protein
MSKRHKLRIHRWHNGVLNTTEHFFESLEDAVLLAQSTDGHSYKIYNENDELVQSGSPAITNAYAG